MSQFKKFGSTAEEDILLAAAKCREIVHEIVDFGVDEFQLLTIIKLLALELENRETMLQITGAIKESLEKKSQLTIEI